MLHCHNICLYEDLFLIKWQHQIESNRCCRHSSSSPVPRISAVIVQLANQRQLIPLPSLLFPVFPFLFSQSHPRLVTSLHDLKLRRRRRFDVCANPRMRMWTCHGIQLRRRWRWSRRRRLSQHSMLGSFSVAPSDLGLAY